jgi:predicted nucleic acid-binding protein
MRLALDTNGYVDLMRSTAEVLQMVESASEVVMPFAVLGELAAGFVHGTRRSQNEQILRQFLQRPSVRSLYPDENTVAEYAVLDTDLRRRGKVIPHNDLWIAALCVQHGLTLFTRDKHFDYVPQVARA